MARGVRPSSGSILGVELFGVPVRFHFTFILLILFVALAGFVDARTVAAKLLFGVALFGSVLLHELGHALTARAYGIGTVEIVLYPIGGISRLEKQPPPKAELVIALAGPVVNIVLAGGVYWAAAATAPGGEGRKVLDQVSLANLYLAVFNLVPAFPMDGGRVLRAVLTMWKGEEHGTRIAAGAGRLLAISLGLYAVAVGDVPLLFIAILIYMSASYEAAASTGRALSQGVPVQAAMMTNFHTLPHGSTLRDAAQLLIATSQQDFPVVHGESVVGLLDRTAFVRGMAMEGPDAYVSSSMDRNFLRLRPDADLASALAQLAESGGCALVMDGNQLRGILTRDNLSEFIMLRKLGVDLGPRGSGEAPAGAPGRESRS